MEVLLDKYNQFKTFYDWTYTLADPRVADWFLMDGFSSTLIIVALYLLAVYVGPRYMADKEPYKLKSAIVFYNFACVVLNFHICKELFYCSLMAGYSYSCQPVRYSYDQYELRIAKAIWWFYFSKCIEMVDTIFFIMRKKNNQVSFLHVYHHATMFPIWYIGVKWVAGGQSFFGAMINSFIHVIMYTYYGVAALGPEYQKYLWWKRYLTRVQLIQFVAGMIHAAQSFYLRCDFPEWMQLALIFYAFTILLFFLNFYFHAYVKSRRAKGDKAAVANGKSSNGHSMQPNGDAPETKKERKKTK